MPEPTRSARATADRPAVDVDALVTHREVIADGVRLHYVEAGPEDGPLVVLLHGFPECWYTWRRQLPALADAGFRVVAPDMRGYNRSEKPHGIDAYRLDRLAGDVAGLIAAVAREGEGEGESADASAHVVGHDWGGAVAWATAAAHPDAVDRLVVLNAPHPFEGVRELSLEQLARSWYVLYFQLPRLPEAGLRAGDFRALERLFREGTVREDAFTDEDVRRFAAAMGRPGALRSALGYYRAFVRRTVPEHLPGAIPLVGPRLVDPVDPVTAPTLVLWGERDAALAVERTRGLDRYATDVRVERFPDAGHWVHVDRPARVSDAIVEFLPE
ncbi:alpha/beta fold hydrolase [Salinilacihabitans rarus]|uniref:alpha/beta fold hydrolase n=1 Tax=Salinilacihabitans rarus TaxID=2961596 RepID=UPI0020C8FB73|nr:alpha/beta fold hydrolase [Salinilacihabitans rarus]